MTNDTTTTPGTSGDNSPGHRDIIAERLAARQSQQQVIQPADPIKDPEEPTIVEQLKSEAVREEALTEAIGSSPIISAPIASEATAEPKLVPVIDKATKSLEARPERKQPDRQQRDEKRRNRNERRERPQPPPQAPQERPQQERREDRTSKQEKRPEQKRQSEPKPQRPEPSGKPRSLAAKLGVSVVIPLLNEQDSLRELAAALREELRRLCDKNYEIIFINDGSTDRSAEILRDLVAASSRISTLTFRRNAGKSAALAAGFKEARYGIVITMDADLQDDPKELANLIAKLDEGYDLVSGWKKKRHDPASKTLPSKFFNAVTSFFSGIRLHDFNCGLKAYRREVVESLEVYGELHRYLPALAHWKGFRVTELPVTHHPRRFGKSKFGTSRFFKGFLDLLSIVFVNRYGKRPLHLFGTVGTLLAILGLGINTYVTIEWFGGIALSNRPILLLGVLLILVGVQLISIGLLGEMIVKNSGKTLDNGYIRDRRPPKKH
jgi:glycosyltransferase involved in cell wall biosynthesis